MGMNEENAATLHELAVRAKKLLDETKEKA